MAVSSTLTTTVAESQHTLSSDQILRASNALLRKIQFDGIKQTENTKPSLLDDADNEDAEDEVPIWLIMTTKKHIIDKKRLKPGKILLPHPYLETDHKKNLRICLITANPQRQYKDLIAKPDFPTNISQRIQKVIDINKLKAKYKSFESRRQLFGEYDVFLADDRIITLLPQTLGKVFYKSGSKRPIPISLEGRRQSGINEQGAKRRKLAEGGAKVGKEDVRAIDVAHEVQRTLQSALVHLAPSTTTAIKIGTASMSAEHVQKNISAVVETMVERYVPQKWRNLRAVHIKGPETAALPIWLAQEMWEDDQDVLDEAPIVKERNGKKRARDVLVDSGNKRLDVVEIPGPDGQIRRIERPDSKKQRLGLGDEASETAAPKMQQKKNEEEDEALPAYAKARAQAVEMEKKEKAIRTASLKSQKERAKSAAAKTASNAKVK